MQIQRVFNDLSQMKLDAKQVRLSQWNKSSVLEEQEEMEAEFEVFVRVKGQPTSNVTVIV